MAFASCDCCIPETHQCPSGLWIELHSWVGSEVLPNDLRLMGNTPFRLSLTFNGATERSDLLSPTATLAEIQSALEGLANVGSPLTVLTNQGTSNGSLPWDVLRITFDSPATQNQTIPLLRILDRSGFSHHGWEVSEVRAGSSSVSAIQSFQRKAGVFESHGLENYEDAVWQWRVLIKGTGDIPDLTELCLAQNRRDWKKWTTPIGPKPHAKYFKVVLTGNRWADSALVGTLNGGSFVLSLTVGATTQQVTVPWNATASSLAALIQGLSNIGNAGTLSVSGGPLVSDHFSVSFFAPIEDVSLGLVSSALTSSTPPLIVDTLQDGDATKNEIQSFQYSWPAKGGTFALTVTTSGGSATTGPIPWDAEAFDVASALAALSILNTVPTLRMVAGGNPTHQVVETPYRSTVTGGTFRLFLTLHGTVAWTPPIPITTPAATQLAIRSALYSMSNVGASDTFLVSGVVLCPFSFTIEFGGSLVGTTIPIGSTFSNLTGGDVVVSGSVNSAHSQRFVEFTGAQRNQDLVPMTASSSLIGNAAALLSENAPSDWVAFRNEFEELNVGTIWKHFLRMGWGNEINRTIRLAPPTQTINPKVPPVSGYYDVEELPCGYGIFAPGYCHPDAQEIGVRQTGFDAPTASAHFNKDNGTIEVVGGLPWEFAFQVRCVGCYYSAEFGLWGIHESSKNQANQIYDYKEREAFEPESSGPCDTDGGFESPGQGSSPGGQQLCREWRYRPGNVPYLFRKRNGPDGFDAHLIRDRFFADGSFLARKTPCRPEVVLLGSGYYLEQNYSKGFSEFRCDEILGAVTGYPFLRSCPPRPYHENEVEHPTSNVERLKAIYGTKFSWWGGWIDPESLTLPQIRCSFGQYDLEDVEVLFLGGMPVGKCPQENNRSGYDGRPGWSGTVLYPEAGDEPFASGNSWLQIVDHEFESTALEPLKRWLNQGGKTLVLDGGVFPSKLLLTLGLTTTVEPLNVFPLFNGQPPRVVSPNTLNGSLFTNPVWGPQLPDWSSQQYHDTFFKSLWVEPHPHPFTNGVPLGTNTLTGDFNLVPDFTIETTNIAGHPIGTPHANRGLVNLSQKYAYDDYLFNTFGLPGGLRSYTTAVPKIVTGSNTTVLGSVRGELLIPPLFAAGAFVTYLINYPGVVVEEWTSSGGLPSRVVISSVCELVEPLAWGTNVEGLRIGGGEDANVYSQEKDDQVYLWLGGVFGPCQKHLVDYYGKRGYNFGLGLSHVAAAKFLSNLWEYRHDF